MFDVLGAPCGKFDVMPKPPRFFIAPDQIQGDRIVITGDDVRHIRAVLRKQPGDLLALLDGNGTEYIVEIVAMDRTDIVTRIREQAKREVPGPRVMLGQGLPKADKMDWIVQKATELGVSSIVPLVMERTIVKIRDEEKRTGRWRKIAREAAMQSNRPDIPTIEAIRRFGDFLRTLDPEPRRLLLFPWEEGTEPLRSVLARHRDAGTIVVLIGPEGGFSQDEASAARERGFHPVSLGPRVLRTETAALAALSMIQYEYL